MAGSHPEGVDWAEVGSVRWRALHRRWRTGRWWDWRWRTCIRRGWTGRRRARWWRALHPGEVDWAEVGSVVGGLCTGGGGLGGGGFGGGGLASGGGGLGGGGLGGGGLAIRGRWTGRRWARWWRARIRREVDWAEVGSVVAGSAQVVADWAEAD